MLTVACDLLRVGEKVLFLSDALHSRNASLAATVVVAVVRRHMSDSWVLFRVVIGRYIITSSLLLFFTFLLFTTVFLQVGFLPWKTRVAFPGESQLRQSRATQPTVHAGCFSVSLIH